MTTTLKEIEDEMMKKFDEEAKDWKYVTEFRKSEIKRFLSSFALKVAEATRDAVLVEEVKATTPFRQFRKGWTKARQESLNGWNTFIGNNE